ncbi:MAG: hypothetical protein KKA55_02975 [Proteobacteria bacterium]|nr:hypothetical protein [Pseudomonadota bacterium]MBU1594480.1 hypothetical protein [Pseudomonadota bacterium]
MPSSTSLETARSARNAPAAPHHPVGLLYTLLRHGRGLSHEEAAHRSAQSLNAQPVEARSGHAQPRKAA